MKVIRSAILVVVVLSIFQPKVHAISWTEDFSSGVGRLSNIFGTGNVDYVHNAANQNLDARFVRKIPSSARYATLGSTFDQNSVARMSVEITPLSLIGGRPRLGFFDSLTGEAIIWVELDNAPLPGRIGPLHIGIGSGSRVEFEFGSLTTWDFNETYLLDIALDGLANELSLSASIKNGGSFNLLRSDTFNYGNSLSFSFDAVGIGNINDPSGQGAGNTFDAQIDNVSFSTPMGNGVIVPEPASALMILLSIGGLMTRRRTIN